MKTRPPVVPVTTCPHCGKRLTTYGARHLAACAFNPAVRDAYRAVLDDPAHPGQCLAADAYDAVRPDELYGSDRLRTACGTWPAVAERFGLVPTPRAQYQQEAHAHRRRAGEVLREVGEENDAAIAAARVANESYVSVPPAYRGERLATACMAAPGMFGSIVREDGVRVHVALW